MNILIIGLIGNTYFIFRYLQYKVQYIDAYLLQAIHCKNIDCYQKSHTHTLKNPTSPTVIKSKSLGLSFIPPRKEGQIKNILT